MKEFHYLVVSQVKKDDSNSCSGWLSWTVIIFTKSYCIINKVWRSWINQFIDFS
jgi:hypothetical protein